METENEALIIREVRDIEIVYMPTSFNQWEKGYQRGNWRYYKTTLICGHVLFGMRYHLIGEMIACPTCERTPLDQQPDPEG